MAQLALQLGGGAIGSYFGGPIGGAIGSAVGSLLGNLLFPPKPQQVGPRVTDRAVVSSAYGEPIFDSWGTFKLTGHLVDSSDLKERKHKVKAAKGFLSASPTGFYYTYSVDACWLFRRRQANGFLKFWLDTKLVRNPGSTASLSERIASNFSWKGGALKFYSGAEDQLPDPAMEALHGVGNVPAYRGVVIIVGAGLELADFANRVPGASAEIFDSGTTGVTLDSTAASALVPPLGGSDIEAEGGWHHVDDNGEILLIKTTSLLGIRNRINQASTGVFRISPTGEFIETKFGSSVRNPRVNVMPGVFDVAGYCYYGSDESSVLVFVVVDVLRNREIQCEDISGSSVSFLIYTNEETWMYDHFGDRLLRYGPAGGTPIAYPVSAAVTFTDGGASEEYLYFIDQNGTGANAHNIYKYDKATVTLQGTFVPTIADHTTGLQESQAAIYVRSDQDIVISVIAANEGPVHIYKYNPTSNTTVYVGAGSLNGTAIIAGEKTKIFYSNGIYYFGSQYIPLAVATDNRIFRFIESGSANATLLSTIVADCCKLAGLASPRYDVTELTDQVWGYARDAQTSPADMIRALMNVYGFDACESDGKIKFKKRGRAPSFTIPVGDLAAHADSDTMPDKHPTRQVQERQLPAVLRVKYVQKDKDYERGMQYSERIISDLRNIVEVDAPVAMSDSEARSLAEKLLPLTWSERNSREVRLSRKYVKLEVADSFELSL